MSSTETTQHEAPSPDPLPLKPRARGWIHLIATPVVLCAVMAAIAIPQTLGHRLSVAVFGTTSVLLFGASAIYHLGNWSSRLNAFLRRLDHSNIFLLIAGTYTPLAVLVLAPDQRDFLLTVVWAGAIAGILLRQFWSAAPQWVFVPVYLALGWVAVWFLPDFHALGGNWVVWFIILGGVFYSLGAIAYATKYPNFFPATFGYHEIFHLYTIIAWTCHFVAIFAAM
ncbi:PAQR family membrane homeostasis protein TrhA [Enteractinococcus coprophilus]|uniref:Hemolysin III n=1 Tax=Enteractinococcus coprophilus TaxID=1027633 RepID=A0A543AF62_9MICC|nr:hemolysin III family protein [Enteractinococcus coprophilus]TQL71213.1 hemolysin III [Enteractinococcus coprophilus]